MQGKKSRINLVSEYRKICPPRRKILIITDDITIKTCNMRPENFISMISAVISALISVGCSINDEPDGRQVTDYQKYEVTVASEKVPGVVTSCGNNFLTDVYAVRYAGEDEWKMLPSISGFEYESGYEYTLQISRTDYLDYSMGEPAWTEYALIEEISKEAKISENLPNNFIPEWYFEQYCADVDDFAYKVEAEQPEPVINDIGNNPAFSFNGGKLCMAGLGQWLLLDSNNNVENWGSLKRVSMSVDEMPEIYRIFPPDDVYSIRGYGRLEFMKLGDNGNSLMQFDIFFAPSARSKVDQPIPHSFRLWLYKDLTEDYKKKYPDAGVEAVIVRYCVENNYLTE